MPQLRKEQLNSLSANWSTYTYTATAGDTFTDLPAGFEAATVTQTSGGDPSVPTRGIVTADPDNYVKIKLQSDGSSLSDSGNIFGRLTYSAGTYTVTYYKLSSGLEVSATLPGSGSYDLTIVFPEVMQFSEVPASALITLGENSGGGAGTIIIPDGGTISGTYNATVYCQGSATVGGALTVNGDLIVVNNLINDSSYLVDIKGSLIAVEINFDPATTVQIQDNLTVGGNLIADSIYYAQTVGSNSNLIVKGNATIYSGIFANGYDDANGLDIQIFGDLKAGDASVEISGGNANATDFGGNGGQLLVYGDASVYALYAYGGDADDSMLLTGLKTAGNGGHLEVRSNFNGRVVLDGGDAFEASAGDAGTCIIDGHAQLIYCDATGGLCNSSNENHRSGSGGDVDISGGLNSSGTIDLSGGSRIGTLTTNGTQLPPDGGNITIFGSVSADSIISNGGSMNTVSFAPSNAGNGGNINFYGSVSCTDITINGGNSTTSWAGNGGNITITKCSITCSNIQSNGGNSSNGDGGNGGDITGLGYIIANTISLDGGDGNEGEGGSAGEITFTSGYLMVDSAININGGDCVSTNGDDNSGSGGSINVSSLTGQSDIYGNAGDRTGNTTALASPGDAGGANIDVFDGPMNVRAIYLNGGSSTPTNPLSTHYPNANGGDGGSIRIHGNFNFLEIELSGGSSYGRDAGSAGYLEIDGFTSNNATPFTPITAIGGDSFAITTPAAPSGLVGSGGTFYFLGGTAISKLESKDGSSGSATTSPMEIILGGHCSFGTLDVTNRTNSKIYGNDSKPTTLKVLSMPTKTTLDVDSMTASASVSSYLSDSIFSYSTASWYRHTGVAI